MLLCRCNGTDDDPSLMLSLFSCVSPLWMLAQVDSLLSILHSSKEDKKIAGYVVKLRDEMAAVQQKKKEAPQRKAQKCNKRYRKRNKNATGKRIVELPVVVSER